MPEFNVSTAVGIMPGYRDSYTIDLSTGDWVAPNGGVHVYAGGQGDITFRTLTGTTDQAVTIAAGGGAVRLGDLEPIIVGVIRQTGTTATNIQVGIF